MHDETAAARAPGQDRRIAGLWGLVLSLGMGATGSAAAGVIPSARTVDWSMAGYGGPIPRPATVLEVGNFGAKADGKSNDAPAITAALAALKGKPGVVHLPAGTYAIASTIGMPSNAILRGDGAGVTTLACAPPSSGSDCIGINGKLVGAFRAVTAGATLGSKTITLADAGGFVAGDWAELRETNGTWDSAPATWAKSVVGQMVRVTGVSGNQLTIDAPLRLGYEAALNPEICRVAPAHHIGIEDLTLARTSDPTPTSASYNIGVSLAVYAWIRGVEGNKSIGSHCMISRSARIQVTGNWFHEAYTYDGSGTRGYGVTLSDHAGECLIEGNIFVHLRHAMMVKAGANGNVFGYNDSHDPYRSETFNDFAGEIALHGHYAFANLFEGNTVGNIIIDQYWGPSGPYNTFFRNRADGYGILITPDSNVTNSQNFVGNEVQKGKSNALLALYYTLYWGILGKDHFEYGNDVAGALQPAGTGTLGDISYYRSPTADFCELAPAWPSIGPPSALGTGVNRARERYLAAGALTYDALWVAAGPTATYAEGGSAELAGAAGGGWGKTTTTWSPATGLADASTTATSVNADVSTLYLLTVADAHGCALSDGAAITVTGTVAAVSIAPPGGTYPSAQAVTLATSTKNASIHYTLDGSPVTIASPVYGGPVSLSHAATVTAQAFKPDFASSAVATASYDIDIDECAATPGPCAKEATCTNSWGAFVCVCGSGFGGDGVSCTDIDECASGSLVCPAGLDCFNVPGSAECLDPATQADAAGADDAGADDAGADDSADADAGAVSDAAGEGVGADDGDPPDTGPGASADAATSDEASVEDGPEAGVPGTDSAAEAGTPAATTDANAADGSPSDAALPQLVGGDGAGQPPALAEATPRAASGCAATPRGSAVPGAAVAAVAWAALWAAGRRRVRAPLRA